MPGQGTSDEGSEATPPARRYDKGQRRFKHVGSIASAVVDKRRPRRVVGKCPNNIGQQKREALLQQAIPPPGAPSSPYYQRLYLTHDGVIYECKTSDHGKTYHAYPYSGRMQRSLLESLRATPDAQKHLKRFHIWIAEHITVSG